MNLLTLLPTNKLIDLLLFDLYFTYKANHSAYLPFELYL